MARDGVPVGPEFAALVARYVAGERFDVTAACRELGASTSSFYKYLGRFRAEGVDGFYPRSRRPLTTPTAVGVAVEDAVVRARKELSEDGWDAGADSIRFWLEDHPDQLAEGVVVPSRATVNRILRRRGLAELVPKRRPRRAGRRFEAERPNTRWQMDGFVVKLADGTTVVVLHLLDDCSRLDLGMHVMTSENTREVWAGILATTARHGLPREMLTDNGTAFSGKRRGWSTPIEENLAALGVHTVTCRPGHPQTCGKVERAHKTVRAWLARRPPAASPEQLQALLEDYRAGYNHRRKQHLHGLSPAQRYALGPLDGPAPGPLQPAPVISTVKVSTSGCIGVLGHLVGIGRRHAGRTLTMIRQSRTIAVLDDHTLIAEIDLKPDRRYQPARPRNRVTSAMS
jgi:transposase InsO family protein